ncbi:MAG: hypothetical protein ABI851_15960 [Saprospiraceae bacterium]
MELLENISSSFKDRSEHLDLFLKSHLEIVLKVAYNLYPEDAFLSFEFEMKYFYERLLKRSRHEKELGQCLHFIFCGICSFYLRKYDVSLGYLKKSSRLNKKLSLIALDEIIAALEKQIKIILDKEKILILVSPGDQNTKWSRVMRKWLIQNNLYTKNYYLKVIDTAKYANLQSLKKEFISASFVFFVGHGGEYFTIVFEDDEFDLTPEILIDLFPKGKNKIKLLSLLSCGYEGYKELYKSKLFPYFIASTNSGDEHSEIFIKAFIDALDFNQNIDDSLYLGRLALMGPFPGIKQIEVYKS